MVRERGRGRVCSKSSIAPPFFSHALAPKKTQQKNKDLDFSPTAPLVATSLVTGQALVHRYEPAASTSGRGGGGGALTLSAEQVLLRESGKKGASARALRFSAGDGAHLLIGFETGVIVQVDAATGATVRRFRSGSKGTTGGGARPSINRLLPLPGARALLAVGDEDGGLELWDLRVPSGGGGGGSAPVAAYGEHTDYISDLATHSRGGGALVATSGDGTLSVHDLRAPGKAVARSEDDADDELLSGVFGGGARATRPLCARFTWVHTATTIKTNKQHNTAQNKNN